MINVENNIDFMVGDITVSLQHNMMTKGKHTCNLQPKAMALLHYLAKNNNRVIDNDELLEQVWQGRVVTNSSIQKCVNTLRAAFTELDESNEYVVYFSKRGYQLVTPNLSKNSGPITTKFYWRSSLILIISTLAAYLSYQYYPLYVSDSPEFIQLNPTQFSQVRPYISNTGREVLIEPHTNSERVALIRNEYSTEDNEEKSYLFLHGINGKEWQVSVARGDFTKLAWSTSGRNLVVIDAHIDSQGSSNYSTLHIYTLDFKGEKVIEKNILSHWLGNISSVSWWDENTLEFTATQGPQYQRTRYRYSIADQNLSKLNTPTEHGTLLNSHTNNKKTAIHTLFNSAEQIQFIDEHQQIIGKWTIPFKVISISWISDGNGVLLLSSGNLLSQLSINGELSSVDYSPKVSGLIKQVRSKNKGRNIILTVHPIDNRTPEQLTNDLTGAAINSERFMKNGGGFIYSTTP